jgi:hypothetical protein
LVAFLCLVVVAADQVITILTLTLVNKDKTVVMLAVIVHCGEETEAAVKHRVTADITAVALDSTAMVVILLGVVVELLDTATAAGDRGVPETVV